MEKASLIPKRALPYLIAGFFLCMAGLRGVDSFIQNDQVPQGIITYEFVKTLPNAQAAIASWDATARAAVGFSLGVDYLYLVLYSLLGFHFLMIVAGKLQPFTPSLAKQVYGMAYLFPLAGLLDALENYGLLRLLLGSENPLWPPVAYYAAVVKFTFVGVGLVVMIAGGLFAFYKRKTA